VIHWLSRTSRAIGWSIDLEASTAYRVHRTTARRRYPVTPAPPSRHGVTPGGGKQHLSPVTQRSVSHEVADRAGLSVAVGAGLTHLGGPDDTHHRSHGNGRDWFSSAWPSQTTDTRRADRGSQSARTTSSLAKSMMSLMEPGTLGSVTCKVAPESKRSAIGRSRWSLYWSSRKPRM